MNKEQENPNKLEDNKAPEFHILRSVQTIVLFAILLATLFTLWNPFKLFESRDITTAFQQTQQVQLSISGDEGKPIIGILAGHAGKGSGAVCEDGLTEADVNLAIANMVKNKLENLGYAVFILSENAMEIINFEGFAFVALYCGSCEDSATNSSGFIVANSLHTQALEATNTLAACMGDAYQRETGMYFTYKILANDLAVSDIIASLNPYTPVVFIEMGSLFHDRKMLVEESVKVAEGISKGIRCYYSAVTGAQ